jgi:hypothetical protein
MEHIIEAESNMVVKFKFEAFKADASALRKHLKEGFRDAGFWYGDFIVMTEDIHFEEHIVGVEYDFLDGYTEEYNNAVWDCINTQLDSFYVTVSC